MTVPATIDAHHHLWDLRRHRYPWLQDAVRPTHFGDYAAIRRDYLIDDYLADIAGQNVEAAIEAVLQSGKVTADLRPSGAPVTTEQVRESVCAAIG